MESLIEQLRDALAEVSPIEPLFSRIDELYPDVSAEVRGLDPGGLEDLIHGFYSRFAGIVDGGPGNTRREILLALLCMFEVQRRASAEGLTSREWGLKWGMTLVFQEDAGE